MPTPKGGVRSNEINAKAPTIRTIVEAVMMEREYTDDVMEIIRSLGPLFKDVEIKKCIDPNTFQPFILAPVRFDLEVIER